MNERVRVPRSKFISLSILLLLLLQFVRKQGVEVSGEFGRIVDGLVAPVGHGFLTAVLDELDL